MIVVVLLFFTSACSALPQGNAISIDPSTGYFIDSQSRVRIFHGINAVYKQPPFHPDIDGPFNSNTSFNDQDIQNLYDWGFNFVRLGFEWVGFEPQKNAPNATYANVMQRLVTNLAKRDIYTLVDFHQDIANRYFCGEGFPDWTVDPNDPSIHGFPFPVVDTPYTKTGYPAMGDCLIHFFGDYYFSESVNVAFQNLYENVNGMQDSFVSFWTRVAQYFAQYDYVIGFEIINEPFGGNVFADPSLLLTPKADKKYLAPLYDRVATAIRQRVGATAQKLMFFEKSLTNNLLPAGFAHVPGGDAYRNQSVYSFHDYCLTPNPLKNSIQIAACDAVNSYYQANAVADIKRLGGGGMMTEFGACSNTTANMLLLSWQLQQADSNLLSWAYWQFKSFRDLTTQGGDGESFYDDDGTLQINKLKTLSRTYAPVIAGVPVAMSFEPTTAAFQLRYRFSAHTTGGTLIYLNEQLHYTNGYRVSIQPSNVAIYSKVGKNRLEFTHTQPFTTLQIDIVAA